MYICFHLLLCFNRTYKYMFLYTHTLTGSTAVQHRKSFNCFPVREERLLARLNANLGQ